MKTNSLYLEYKVKHNEAAKENNISLDVITAIEGAARKQAGKAFDLSKGRLGGKSNNVHIDTCPDNVLRYWDNLCYCMINSLIAIENYREQGLYGGNRAATQDDQ
jgi:hypothetical protein